jgi:uncharacterized protein (TIGR02996 family)
MPHNPFPDPAAVLPGEAEMLSAVLANLTDDLPKLVYADWLEERGDPRGPFLRAFVHAIQQGGELPDYLDYPWSWTELTGISILNAAWKHDLSIGPDELLRDAIPGLSFTSTPSPANSDLPLGCSKFGGHPDMPPDVDWPECEDRSLSFLAQFNLDELSASPASKDLPRSGLLSVFFSMTTDPRHCDTGEWRLFHFATDELQRRAVPTGLREHQVSHECLLTFRETLVLPEHLKLESDAEYEVYHEHVYEQFRGHWLLAQPPWLSDGPDWWLQRSDEFRHLLALDSDENPGWNWGNNGSLFFSIREADLRAKRFFRTRLDYDCEQ